MLFKLEDLEQSILYCEDNEDMGLEFIEASEWEQDHKYQSRYIIFKYDGKYYRIFETRSGSPFSDWHYEDHDIDENGMVRCDEVFKTKKVIDSWSLNNYISEFDELVEKLSYAEELLLSARSLMDNVHCYDSDIYKEIGTFLYGEDE